MDFMQTSYIHGVSGILLLGLPIDDRFDEMPERYPDNQALIVRHESRRRFKAHG